MRRAIARGECGARRTPASRRPLAAPCRSGIGLRQPSRLTDMLCRRLAGFERLPQQRQIPLFSGLRAMARGSPRSIRLCACGDVGLAEAGKQHRASSRHWGSERYGESLAAGTRTSEARRLCFIVASVEKYISRARPSLPLVGEDAHLAQLIDGALARFIQLMIAARF